MKSILQLAFLALVMFSVSAGLSIWLYQQKQPVEKAESEKDTKKKDKEPEHPAERTDAKHDQKPVVKPPVEAPKHVSETPAREARLEKRIEQVDLILLDLRSQRDVYEGLMKQLNAELKLAGNRVVDTDAKVADLEKRKLELDSNERKNIERMATLYDSMTPEAAAQTMKQMSDTGRLDTAVKILSLMKERQAARLLDALGDPMLAAQMLDRMRGLKPVGGVVPASGKQP